MECRLLDGGAPKPERFHALAQKFVLVQIDTKNGTTAETQRLLVQRNAAYLLFLDKKGREFYRMADPGNARKGQGRSIRWPEAIARMEAALADPPKGKEGAELVRELLTCDDPYLRAEAVCHIRDRGAAAAPFVPDLLKALDDPAVYGDAVAALGSIGPAAAKAIPALIACLNTEKTYRQATAIALGRIDTQGKAALPALVPLLRAGDANDAIGAAVGLGHLGEAAAPAVDDLIALLDSPVIAVRFYAIQTLGKIGPQAAKASARLDALGKERDGGKSHFNPHRAAREALKRIGAPGNERIR